MTLLCIGMGMNNSEYFKLNNNNNNSSNSNNRSSLINRNIFLLFCKIQGPYSQLFIFFVTYERVQRAGVLLHTELERLAREKHSSLPSSFLSYK